MWLWVIVLVGTGGLVLMSTWLIRREKNPPGVLEVRRTPRRAVREMTVEAFYELGRDYLEARGFELTADPEGDPLAVREGEARRVFFDPAAEAEDPRYLNQLVAKLHREDVGGGWLITSARLNDRGRSLANRGDLRVAEPETLITWRRDGEDGDPA